MPFVHPRERFARSLAPGARVLDLGCWGGAFRSFCIGRGITGLVHGGVDREWPPGVELPPDYRFIRADLEAGPTELAPGSFDALVISHLLEHVTRPLPVVDEAFRLLRAGGVLYVETPSERSLRLPGMPFGHSENRSLSFYDDPTHVGRPHTPQSLHRLFRMYGAEPLECAHIVSSEIRWRLPWLLARALWTRDAALLESTVWLGVGFSVFGIARKGDTSVRAYLTS